MKDHRQQKINYVIYTDNARKRFLLCILYFLFSGFSYSSFGQSAEEYFDSGNQKFESKNYSGAIADISKAIELKSDYVAAYFLRAEAKKNLKDFRGSLLDFNKALSIKPSNDTTMAVVYLDRGMVKLNLNDLIGGESDFTKAIAIKSHYAEAYFNRGIARLMLKKKSAGCMDLSKAGELGLSRAYEIIQEECQ